MVMITTREFFETDADNIIMDLETFWTVQRDGSSKYINVPFPSKKEFLNRYETGLDDPFDDLSDYDDISEAEEQQMIQEQKDRISKVYDVVKEIRDKFQEKYK
jgi:hypothetical protein